MTCVCDAHKHGAIFQAFAWFLFNTVPFFYRMSSYLSSEQPRVVLMKCTDDTLVVTTFSSFHKPAFDSEYSMQDCLQLLDNWISSKKTIAFRLAFFQLKQLVCNFKYAVFLDGALPTRILFLISQTSPIPPTLEVTSSSSKLVMLSFILVYYQSLKEVNIHIIYNKMLCAYR